MSRPLSEIPFAQETEPELQELRVNLEMLPQPSYDSKGNTLADPAKDQREALQAKMQPYLDRIQKRAEDIRNLLHSAGVETAGDIERFGCTGLFMHGTGVDDIHKVRLSLGGTGVGLPCYVPDTRYCLAHRTLGGLQDGQKARYEAAAQEISRPLTKQEEGKWHLVNRVRSMQGRKGDALNALTGRNLPEDMVDDAATDGALVSDSESAPAAPTSDGFVKIGEAFKRLSVGVSVAREMGTRAHVDQALADLEVARSLDASVVEAIKAIADHACTVPFKCDDHHGSFLWTCRYCVAAKIVSGSLEPQFFVAPAEEGCRAVLDNADMVPAEEMQQKIQDLDEAGASAIGIFVKVTTLRRGLSEG